MEIKGSMAVSIHNIVAKIEETIVNVEESGHLAKHTDRKMEEATHAISRMKARKYRRPIIFQSLVDKMLANMDEAFSRKYSSPTHKVKSHIPVEDDTNVE